jgi:hypothetical protein
VEPSQCRVEQRPWQQELAILVAVEPALQVRGKVLGAPLHELAALLQPVSQAGPGAEECLVGDLDGGLAAGGGLIRGEQPGVDQPLMRPLVVLVPLREPGWPAEVPRAGHGAGGAGLGGLRGDEAEQDALEPRPVVRAEVLPQLLGSADQRPLRARQVRPVRKVDTQAPVGLLGQDAARRVAFPQFCQRELQQRQVTRAAAHVRDEPLRQAGLKRAQQLCGGCGDGLAQVLFAHRRQRDLSGRQLLAQIGQRQVVEIGPQPDHHLHLLGGQASQQRDEPFPLGVLAIGVEPLELVDHHDHFGARSGGADRRGQLRSRRRG